MEDLHIENVLSLKKRKRGVQSGKKGSRKEREVVQMLNERFSKLIEAGKLGAFSRSVGSGNRWAQVSSLPSHAVETFIGDLTCPKGFLFSIEVKGGYNDINLMQDYIKSFEKFLEQAQDQSNLTHKKPILFFKQDRKPCWCFLKHDQLLMSFSRIIKYNEWYGVLWDELKELPDDFFFSAE